MNVLILGSGGREHAFAWKISQSKLVNKLFVAPGNAGTAQCASNVSLNPLNFSEIGEFVKSNNIELLIVGPEDPLVAGIADYFRTNSEFDGVFVVGPDKKGAMLEGSKDFAKLFMNKYAIPTAGYFSANKENIDDAISYLSKLNPPYVLKADGLAAGKGVLITETLDEATSELQNMLNGKFGAAGNTVVIEEFLDGIECSVFVLTDGDSYVILPEAKDYKRIGEGNTGLNTGGMGAITPVPFYDLEFAEKVETRIIKPTIEGIKSEKMDYRGFVFLGLMNVKGNPYVIEYNVRMGDPETEAVLPRIDSDMANLLYLTAKKQLSGAKIEISKLASTTLIIVSGGYPGDYEKHKIISGVESVEGSIVFHSGTTTKEGNLVSAGGRVLAVTSSGENIFDALEKSYQSAKKINFDKMYYRTDLGFDLK
ncbi:MAG: phosphoribosylamine--glycine ligase [Bacteroidales bacterium]|nr:phosphoribosylamine--glycine ligase [Bacteroidales bacterium]